MNASASPAAVTVSVASSRDDDQAWTGWLVSRADATPFHSLAWREVGLALGHEPLYLLAREGARVRGVLPLFVMRRLGGRDLVSVPAAAYGSALAEDPAIADALAAEAVRMACERGLRQVELRSLEPTASAGFDASSPCVRVVLAGATPREALPAIARRHLKRAERSGIEVDDDASISDFYEPYLSASDRLGSPAFGREFFERIAAAFGRSARAFVGRFGGRPIASMLWLTAGSTRFWIYGGSTDEGREKRAGYALLWATLSAAPRDGIAALDLGRSFRTSPSRAFKDAWGGRTDDVWFHVRTLHGRVRPPLDPESRLFRAARQCWRRLPTRVRRRLGPVLVRRLH